MFLNEQEKQQLANDIRRIEAGTRAEIVTVIATESDSYRYIPTLWAALIALSLPSFFYVLHGIRTAGWATADDLVPSLALLYQWQVLVFLGLALVFQLPTIRTRLIPTRVKHKRASRHAREQFFLQNLHRTEERIGVLVFVSVAEHFVEILVDSGISEKIDNQVWEDTIAEFVTNVRRGDIAKGFASTLEHCREVLWQHFPDDKPNPNVIGWVHRFALMHRHSGTSSVLIAFR